MTLKHIARASAPACDTLIAAAAAVLAMGWVGAAQAQPAVKQQADRQAARAAQDPGAPAKDLDEGAVPTKPAVSPPSDVDELAKPKKRKKDENDSDAVPKPLVTLPPAPGDEPVRSAELYGPPAPKAKKGKLPSIGWTASPEGVPPALDEAINIVTRNYPSAKSARAALAAAASDVKAAKWLRFPNFSGNLAYLNNDRSVGPEPQLVVEMPLWTAGRLGAEIRRAKASEDASSASYVNTVQTLALTTTQAYFEVVRLAQREKLLAESLAEHRRLVGTMERRVAQEVSPQADLELARSRSAQIEQEYTINRAQRRSTLRILAELIADPSYDLGSIPPYLVAELPNRDALEDQGVAYDPSLRRLRAQADVARADFDSRKASIFPQVNAQYSYDDVFNSRVGLVVRAQNTGGLRQFSEVDSAKLRIQSALEDARVAEQQLRREIANDLIELDAGRARAEISTGASETAARVSESYMRQFIAGRRSWLDVMNALREAVTAQLGKVDSQASAMSAAVRLNIRSGRWHPTFEQEPK